MRSFGKQGAPTFIQRRDTWPPGTDMAIRTAKLLSTAAYERFAYERRPPGRLRPCGTGRCGDGCGLARRLLHRYRDLVAHHGRLVRDVIMIAQQQLQRVLAGLQRHGCFRLAAAEMLMVIVGRQRG